MTTLPPDRLIDSIRHYAEVNESKFLAIWYCISGGREEYAERVIQHSTDFPVIPLVPRRFGLLETANALHSDLVQLIVENQESCARLASKWKREQTLVFLILSKEPLSIPVASSPVPMPSWFPIVGGTIVNLDVVDLTYSADAPLNCVEADIPSVCEALYFLEGALIRRSKFLIDADGNTCGRLKQLILEPSEDFRSFIAAAEQKALRIEHPGGFRPSVRDGDSFIARFLRLYTKSTPDQLSARAAVVGETLMKSALARQTLVSILLRPTSRETSDAIVWGRNLLTTTYAAFQYSTASAHADAYGRHSISLQNAMSKNLVGGLNALVGSLSD